MRRNSWIPACVGVVFALGLVWAQAPSRADREPAAVKVPAVEEFPEANGVLFAYAVETTDDLARHEAAAPGGGGCCKRMDKIACKASCSASGCAIAFAYCDAGVCLCRCTGCP